eukprot:3323691-Rhodomonas_salina.1
MIVRDQVHPRAASILISDSSDPCCRPPACACASRFAAAPQRCRPLHPRPSAASLAAEQLSRWLSSPALTRTRGQRPQRTRCLRSLSAPDHRRRQTATPTTVPATNPLPRLARLLVLQLLTSSFPRLPPIFAPSQQGTKVDRGEEVKGCGGRAREGK